MRERFRPGSSDAPPGMRVQGGQRFDRGTEEGSQAAWKNDVKTKDKRRKGEEWKGERKRGERGREGEEKKTRRATTAILRYIQNLFVYKVVASYVR